MRVLPFFKLRGARSWDGVRRMRVGFEGLRICGLRALWKRAGWLRSAGSFGTGGD